MKWQIVGAIMVLSTACSDQVSLSLGQNVSSQHLVFRLSAAHSENIPAARMSIFGVERQNCDSIRYSGESVWLIVAKDGLGPNPAPKVIVYGRLPDGYREERSSTPLIPGCYTAGMQGPPQRASLSFRVLSSGAIQILGTQTQGRK
jgi:hypothetical protein